MFVAALGISLAAAGSVTIAYPSQEDPLFTITAPDNWELTPGEESGDYFDLAGPTGATLSFRAFAGSKEDLDAAMYEAGEFLGEYYDNVKLGEAQPSTMGGMPAILLTGSGVDKESGEKTNFVMAWADMKSGNIAELWFAVTPGDTAGAKQAEAIVNSFKSH